MELCVFVCVYVDLEWTEETQEYKYINKQKDRKSWKKFPFRTFERNFKIALFDLENVTFLVLKSKLYVQESTCPDY